MRVQGQLQPFFLGGIQNQLQSQIYQDSVVVCSAHSEQTICIDGTTTAENEKAKTSWVA